MVQSHRNRPRNYNYPWCMSGDEPAPVKPPGYHVNPSPGELVPDDRFPEVFPVTTRKINQPQGENND